MAIVALITGLVVWYVFTPPSFRPGFLNRLEYLAYDQRMQMSVRTGAIDKQVVVVDIDQSSQQKKGRWPWPRNLTGELIATLLEHYQAGGVGLDVYFPDEASCSVSEDSALASVLQRNVSSVVMALKLKDKDKSDMPQNRGDVTGSGVPLLHGGELPAGSRYWGEAVDYSGNLVRFVSPQTAIGHIAQITDKGDARIRRLLPVYQFEGQYYDTLSLSMWRQMMASDGLMLDTSLGHWLDSPKFRLMLGEIVTPYHVPVNSRGEVLIPYQAKVETVSAADVLDKAVDPDGLRGKLVLIGSSAKAQGDDLVATPVDTDLPGVEIHAVMLGAMLAQMNGEPPRFKVQPAYESLLQLALLSLMLLLLFGARRFGVYAMLAAGPLLLTVWVAFNYWMWAKQGIALEILPVAALIALLLLYLGVTDLLDINARHQHVRRMFNYYLPAPVAQRLAASQKGEEWLRPERRDMTVMFADVQGFTHMAESLPPEVIAEITKSLFTGLTEVIHEHNGTVDKYMGDAVMAFWGAPLPDQQHALHAAQAAVVMQKAVRDMNERLFKKENVHIRLGIGINTGTVVVGNLGSDQRHAYTVMGAVVNMASAIQQLTREYPHDILLGEEAAKRMPESMRFEVGEAVTRKLSYRIRIFSIKKEYDIEPPQSVAE